MDKTQYKRLRGCRLKGIEKVNAVGSAGLASARLDFRLAEVEAVDEADAMTQMVTELRHGRLGQGVENPGAAIANAHSYPVLSRQVRRLGVDNETVVLLRGSQGGKLVQGKGAEIARLVSHPMV
jgi:hypothetical protein